MPVPKWRFRLGVAILAMFQAIPVVIASRVKGRSNIWKMTFTSLKTNISSEIWWLEGENPSFQGTNSHIFRVGYTFLYWSNLVAEWAKVTLTIFGLGKHVLIQVMGNLVFWGPVVWGPSYFGFHFRGSQESKAKGPKPPNLTISWLGGGFKHVLFSPLPEEMIQFEFDYIFQMGWNHQLVDWCLFDQEGIDVMTQTFEGLYPQRGFTPENRPFAPKEETIVFQPSIFQGLC